jgi:hypothetical protein
MANQYSNLGNQVSTRTTSWLDLCIRAWGAEFTAPDHDIYKMSNGRGFDSTDRSLNGIYGVIGDDPVRIVAYDARYPDMRDGFNRDFGPGMPNESLNLPFGSYDELVTDNSPFSSGFANPLPETDPYFSSVSVLIHNTIVDSSANALALINTGGVVSAQSPQSFLGDPLALFLNNDGLNAQRYVETPASATAMFQWLANEPLTIEYSVYITARNTVQGGEMVCVAGTGSNISVVSQTTGVGTTQSGASLTMGLLNLNQWYQLAYTYDGAIHRQFVNGILTQQITTALSPNAGTAALSVFGAPFATSSSKIIRGYMKEIRYTKGVQRYGANYTPRTTPFPNS